MTDWKWKHPLNPVNPLIPARLMEIVGVRKEKSLFYLAYLSKINGEIVIEGLEKKIKIPDFRKDLSVVTGIEGQDLLIRQLETPLRTVKALHKTLPFQLEALIPYALEDVIIKPIYDIQERETQVLFFTVPKKTLEYHIAHFQGDGIDPEWVSTIPTALVRFAHFTFPDEKDLVVFHVGVKKMQLVSIRNGKLSSPIILHMGSQDLSDRDRSIFISKLKRQVDRTLCFLAHKEKKNDRRKVLFCGEKAQEVENLLVPEQPLLIPMQLEGHRGFEGETVRSYAVSIGLAIDALRDDSSSIQFRQGAFISKQSYSSIKRGLFYGGIFSAALFALTFTGLQVFYHKKERLLIKQVEGLVSYYGKEIPHLGNGIEGNSLEKVLIDLSLRLRTPKNGELSFYNPPLITDLLNFISSHPKLEGIDVRGIDYGLKSYPSIDRLEDRYRPKVRLVFTTKEAKKAQEFYDAIIDDENRIDREEEIEWKRNEDEYEITFFLQNEF
ncbi:MAG: hypothetical protein AAGE99_04720 [Chlamydiota bacterium]